MKINIGFNFDNDDPFDLEPKQYFFRTPIRFHTREEALSFKDYIVFDFETTGLSPRTCSIIEVGALKVRNGEVVDTFSSFINPHEPLPEAIVKLTGITDEDLSNAPDLSAVLPAFISFCEDLPLVAHNAYFDLSFFGHACTKLEINHSVCFIDTLTLSRISFPELPTHKLGDLILCLHLPTPPQNHRAVDDVVCTNYLLLRCLESYPEEYTYKYNSSQKTSLANLVPSGEVSPDHPLYQKSIVFTGELSISRKLAAQLATDVGALVKSSVSKKTDYLVVGVQDTEKVGAAGISSKEQKTLDLINQGVPVSILDEAAFMQLLKGEHL